MNSVHVNIIQRLDDTLRDINRNVRRAPSVRPTASTYSFDLIETRRAIYRCGGRTGTEPARRASHAPASVSLKDGYYVPVVALYVYTCEHGMNNTVELYVYIYTIYIDGQDTCRPTREAQSLRQGPLYHGHLCARSLGGSIRWRSCSTPGILGRVS